MRLLSALLLAGVCWLNCGFRPADTAVFHPGDTVPEAHLAHGQYLRFFTDSPLPDSLFARMQGNSYRKGCPVSRHSLRYLTCLHKDIHGKTIVGELVAHIRIADLLLAIFRELYENDYPIEKMRLTDHYQADDEASMRDNNTSCFNFRFIAGTRRVSKHGLGLAVYINPLYNPYFRHISKGSGINYATLSPATARPYTDRTQTFPYKIEKGDLCHRLFLRHGFVWGGTWSSCKDYQHFEWP